jgi:hypothetical protein
MGLAEERGFRPDWLDFRRVPRCPPSYKRSTRKVTGKTAEIKEKDFRLRQQFCDFGAIGLRVAVHDVGNNSAPLQPGRKQRHP